MPGTTVPAALAEHQEAVLCLPGMARSSAAPVEPAACFHDILAPNHCGGWVLKLPPGLKSYQGELEALLGKVFEGKGRSSENLELAQQMTLNWCMSKCRKLGIGLDDGFCELQ